MNFNEEVLLKLEQKRIINKTKKQEILEKITENQDIQKYLVENNYCTELQLLPIFAELYGMPYIEMDMLEVDRELVSKFNIEFLEKYNIVPICIDKYGVMIVATSKPFSSSNSVISTYYSGKVDFILVLDSEIKTFIHGLSANKSTSVALTDLAEENESKEKEEVAEDVLNAPAVRLIDSIIKEAIPFRASDIHIEPFEKEIRVRYRVDGDLIERIKIPIESMSAISARLKIMSGMNIAERRIPQDGRINMVIANTEYDFRVSTLPTVYGEKFVIRILNKNAFNFTRTDLGFLPDENEIVNKMLAKPYGIILLTGPTGCGKSTTLYSFLRELNKQDVNIVTVEDPVEYTLNGVNQTQVNTKSNLTFATALRSILRQDPDIIMLGEIRDEETAQIAIRAGITGHLVFSTLHTNDATGVVTRLVDMGVDKYLVLDSLIGVISQRLVKKLCPICKKKIKTTKKFMDILGIDEETTIYSPLGCNYCNGTGYKGRIAIHEILYFDEDLKTGISGAKSIDDMKSFTKSKNIKTLKDRCINYVLNGITSVQELQGLDVD